tara:strand:+ start:1196 stop:1429 length:234 start_codon:yes stop_codon:yes gene_type:complete
MIIRDSIWWIKWISTGLCVASATFTALDIYPINAWTGFAGCVGWAWVGYRWKEWAILNLNVFLGIVYGAGCIRSILI